MVLGAATQTSVCYVIFEDDEVQLIVGLSGGRLPTVVHWGSPLRVDGFGEARSLERAQHPVMAQNIVDHPQLVSILPEHWIGWVGRPGVSGSRPDGAGWTPKFGDCRASVDGNVVDLHEAGQLLRFGLGCLVVEATDPLTELSVGLTIEMLVGGLVRLRGRLRNDGASNYGLHEFVLAMPVPSVADEILDFAGHWGQERVPQRQAFTVGTHLRENRKGRTGFDAATVLHAGTVGFGFGHGEVWGIHVAWSGNHTHFAEQVLSGCRLLGGGELLLPGEVVLEQGEAYESPWLYASYGCGLDGVAQRFHRYLRSRPQHPAIERPVTINVWEAVYFEHRLEVLIELANLAASVGVERYVLDDGWFGARRDDTAGLGDWVVSREVWPNGLHPLVTHVKSLGMQFGLWFEPEMINLNSDTARLHPEWIMAPTGRLPVEARHQQVLNLGIRECYEHVRDQMSALLDEYDIDYIKWDHNRDLIEAGTQPGGAAGVHSQTLATYRLLAELKRSHPGLEIESCSSGGARVDLGILQWTDRVWVSDVIDPLERQKMLRGTSQLLPLEMLGSHIASRTSHSTGRTHDLSFRAGTAFFGHLGIEWDLRQASQDELAQLAEWVALFKRHRKLLFNGNYVRLDLPDESLLGAGVVSPDRREAIFSLAEVGISKTVERGSLRLSGLDPVRRYRVTPMRLSLVGAHAVSPDWWEDGALIVSGSVLMAAGFRNALVYPEHLVLYHVEAVD